MCISEFQENFFFMFSESVNAKVESEAPPPVVETPATPQVRRKKFISYKSILKIITFSL